MDTSPPKARRLDSLDSLRGLAIVTMVCANMASLLQTPHPLPFRFFGSFAAPTFIALSGFFIALGVARGKESFSHFLTRGALILATAALIDILCFGLMPFVQVDVLYLIGVGTPLAYLVSRLSIRTAGALLVAVFALAPVLRELLGYSPNVMDILISGARLESNPPDATVWKHWLVDGWFPLFPWLGFLFFGIVLAKYLARNPEWLRTHLCRRVGLVLALVGAVALQVKPSPMFVREGYSEIFYPATTAFVLLAMGVILFAAWFTAVTESWKIWQPVRNLGRASLFFYVFHLLVISFFLKQVLSPMPLPHYLALYLAFLAALLGIGHLLTAGKRSQAWMRSYLGKFYFGT